MNIDREMINNWNCLVLHGPFIVTNTKEINSIIEEIINSDTPLLAIDLTNVPFMDSSAIGTLLSASKTFKEKNGNMVVFGANDVISDVFRAVHFTHHIPEYQNRGDFIHQNFQ